MFICHFYMFLQCLEATHSRNTSTCLYFSNVELLPLPENRRNQIIRKYFWSLSKEVPLNTYAYMSLLLYFTNKNSFVRLVRRKVCAACADPYAEPYAEPHSDGISLESSLMRNLMRRKAHKGIANIARRKGLHEATLEPKLYAALRPSTLLREISCAGLAPELL